MESTTHSLADGEPPLKRRQQPQQPPDRLSELPNAILLHILSSLSIYDAVRSSSLSKRFQHLWTSLTSLNFISAPHSESIQSFVTFVNETLIALDSPSLDHFKADLCFSSEFTTSINKWILFATIRNVKSLDIDLYPSFRSPSYKLNQDFFYSNPNFTELRISHCEIDPRGLIRWPLLKSLKISSTEINDKLFKTILSGCPVLERLEFKHWQGLNRLKIRSASLRVFKICQKWESWDDEYLLRISAPNLRVLEVSGRFGGELRLRNLTALVGATIDLEMEAMDEKNKDDYQNMLWGILDNVSHVNSLTFGGWSIQVLSSYVSENISPPLLDCQSLTLSDTNIEPWECLALSTLLHASPNLESLIIKLPCSTFRRRLDSIMCCSYQVHVQNFWASQQMKYSCLLHHVKLVKICNIPTFHQEPTHILNFFEFLLANGLVLEQIIIHRQQECYPLRKSSDSCYPLEEKLQQMPKASSRVVFQFLN